MMLRPSEGVFPYCTVYRAPTPPVATPAVIVAAPALAAVIRGVDAEGFAGAVPVVAGTESPAELDAVPGPEPEPEPAPVDPVDPVDPVEPVDGGVVVTGVVVVTGAVVVAGGDVLTGAVDVVPVPVVPFVVSMPVPAGALVAALAVVSVKS